MKPEAGELGELPNLEGRRVAIVSARFYAALADWLEDGARRALDACGVAAADRRLVRVPGCFELPLACRRTIEDWTCEAVVALGVVVRGETPHFDYVAGEAAKGLASVQTSTGLCVAFGVLTTDTIEQAIERAGTKAGNKGWDAAVSAIEMVSLARAIDGALGAAKPAKSSK